MKGSHVPVLVVLVFALSNAVAQQSPSFRLSEQALNCGGHPANGIILSSVHFRITSDAIGDAVAAVIMTGASFQMTSGLLSAFAPPEEVTDLLFSDKETFGWNPASCVGSYNVYRDLLSQLPTLAYGTCFQQALTTDTSTDPSVPTAGDGHFYLITVENTIGEEGTKGFRSDGSERLGTSCP